jgi:hypothetical protein
VRLSFVLAFVFAAILLTGCPRSDRPSLLDGSLAPDAATSRRDTDGDGLCDGQEETRGLRVDHPDTDGDGFSDLMEVSLSFDAFQPTSPNRETIVLMEETTTTGEARVVVTTSVNGGGETYSGSLQSIEQTMPDGHDVLDFYESSGPVGAEPMTNVFAIDQPTQSFLGVSGRTQLVFEVRLAFRGTPAGCMRAYPFQYLVKREDGNIVAAQRFTLVIAPPGSRPGVGTWCGADPCW